MSFDGIKHYVHLCYRFTDQALSKIISVECEEVKKATNTAVEMFDIRMITTHLSNSSIKQFIINELGDDDQNKRRITSSKAYIKEDSNKIDNGEEW